MVTDTDGADENCDDPREGGAPCCDLGFRVVGRSQSDLGIAI